MTTENLMFFIPSSTGLLFLVVGFILFKFPPKHINSFYGYRTRKSIKSQEIWEFSQRYSAKALMKLGFLLALAGLVGLVYHPDGNTAKIISSGLILFGVIILIIKVESAIAKAFKTD